MRRAGQVLVGLLARVPAAIGLAYRVGRLLSVDVYHFQEMIFIPAAVLL